MTLAEPASPTLVLHRPRRLWRTASLRRMVQENQLSVNDLIYPLFVMEGEEQKVEIASMLGCYRYSLDLLLKEVKEAFELGINALELCAVIPKNKKNDARAES